MAEVIDPNFELLPNKVLLLQVGGSDITATVEKIPNIVTGDYAFIKRLILEVFDTPGGGQSPPPTPVIGHNHAYVVFNKESSTEVSLSGTDYFIADVSDILGILPQAYDYRAI